MSDLKLAPVGAFWDEDVGRWYVEMDGDTVCHGLQEQPAKHLRDILISLRADNAAKDARIAKLDELDRVALFEKSINDRDARIAHEREEGDKILAALEMANARIAELEHDLLHGHESGPIRSMRARAEKAEADCKRAEAERDALREMLKKTNHHLATLVNCSDEDEDGNQIPGVREAAKDQVLAVRAALNPSQREG